METSGASVCLEDLDGASWVVEDVMEHTLLSFLAVDLGKWGQALQSVLECSLVYFPWFPFNKYETRQGDLESTSGTWPVHIVSTIPKELDGACIESRGSNVQASIARLRACAGQIFYGDKVVPFGDER